MKKIATLTITTLSLIVLISGCKEVEPEVGTMELEFENMVDGSSINLSSGSYTTEDGKTYTIEGLKYMISNVKLYKSGELKYSEKDSYHLINASDESTLTFVVDSIPYDDYDRIDFAIGVDSDHNDGDASGGDLGTGNGLFWAGWGSYIFYRFDGYYTGGGGKEALAFHIGGDNNYNEYSMELTSSVISISGEGTTMVHVAGDVNQLFTGPNTIDISTTQSVAAEGEDMNRAGENIGSGMFEIHHIHNPGE